MYRKTLIIVPVLLTFSFLLASSIAMDDRSLGNQEATVDILEPSGIVNTKIYVRFNNTDRPAQNHQLNVSGYVTYAANPSWPVWPGISVALLIDGSYVYDAGGIVNATTDSNGNYSLLYDVPFNHSVGLYNMSVGLSPIPNYTYTYNPDKVNHLNNTLGGYTYNPYNLTITANTDISIISYTPAVFWNNDQFSVTGRLLAESGAPIPGAILMADFDGFNITMTNVTGPSGYFSLSAGPLEFDRDMNISFGGSGFYNPNWMNFSLPLLNDANHSFTGAINTAANSSNPLILGEQITISGVFSYNYTPFGFGYVKNKNVTLTWINNNSVEYPIATVTTNGIGAYSTLYTPDPANNPLSGNPTEVRVKATLDTNQVIEFTQIIYIRPQLNTTIISTAKPIWKDQSIVIWGYLQDVETPAYLQNQLLNITLWDASNTTMLNNQTLYTNFSGGFSHAFPAEGLDFVNYKVEFIASGKYNSSDSGFLEVPIYKAAIFTFDPGMKSYAYETLPFNIFGSVQAIPPASSGLSPAPLASRVVELFWNGTSVRNKTTDALGNFAFNYTVPVKDLYVSIFIELRVRDVYSDYGESVEGNKSIEIRDVYSSYEDLTITPDSGVGAPGFEGEDYLIAGHVSKQGLLIDINVVFMYANGSNETYNDKTTLSGSFDFYVPGTWITAGKWDHFLIVANPQMLNDLKNASSQNYPFDVIHPGDVSFEGLSFEGKTTVNQGQSFFISGTARSSGGPIRKHNVTIICKLYNNPQHDVLISQEILVDETTANGVFEKSIDITGEVGNVLTVEFLIVELNTTSHPSGVYEFEIVPPPDYTWMLWLIIPIGAGLFIFGIIYAKMQRKQEVSQNRSLMERKLDIVRELVRAGKNRAAIAYCYHILAEIAVREYDIEENVGGQTVHEFMTFLVKEKGISPEFGYKFMIAIEEGLYSHHDITKESVGKTVQALGELYREITKDITQRFML
ncbi:MAG: carboxypeptidase-like regulatory domain-containing protein [Candidatus Hodarchaeota archaeon]